VPLFLLNAITWHYTLTQFATYDWHHHDGIDLPS